MLPGFRFIVMTLMLATSVLIFGLGAAALLRATHEQFASMPSLRNPEQHLPATFAERFNPTGAPTLAMVRVDPPAQATAQEHPDAKEANLGEQPSAQQSAKDDETAIKPRHRKRLTQARRARLRGATTEKRRLPGRRITLTGLVRKSSSDAFTPLLSSQP